MSSQRKLTYCLAIVVALLGLPQPLVFAETALNQVSTKNSPKLPNIGANDFFPNGKQSATVDKSQDFYKPLSFNLDTRRVVEWEMRVRKNDLKTPLEIEYELTNQLDKNVPGQNPILNVIDVIRIEEREEIREECSSQTEGECETVLVKGAAELVIDVAQFTEAGEYRGRLSVCVKNNNNDCI